MSNSALKFCSSAVFPLVNTCARGSAVARRLVVGQAGFSACFQKGNCLCARLLGTHSERVGVWKNKSAAKFHNSLKNQHVDSNRAVCTVIEGKQKNAVGCLVCAHTGLRRMQGTGGGTMTQGP
jgi:hypothetical protein